MDGILATFTASLRSVGTACTLAGVGMYLHRCGYIVGEGKRTLALISQQVTIPLLLFTKIVYCNQDWSSDPCPSITDSLEDVWMILFWPIYVCGCGLIVGWAVAKVCHTPPNQVRSVLAACGFANSTGLPITLLSVIHANFPSSCELGRIDPTLFLSVYLILYPVLQWGVGGWILCPDEEQTDEVALPNEETKQLLQGETPIHESSQRETLKPIIKEPTAAGSYVSACLKVSKDGGVSVHNCNMPRGQIGASSKNSMVSLSSIQELEHSENPESQDLDKMESAPELPSEHQINPSHSTNYDTFNVSAENPTHDHHHNGLPVTRNVLNNIAVSKWYRHLHSGIQDTDASLYISSANLNEMYPGKLDDAIRDALLRAGVPLEMDLEQRSFSEYSDDASSVNLAGDRYLMIESDSEAALNEVIKQTKTKSFNALTSPNSSSSLINKDESELTPLITEAKSSANKESHSKQVQDVPALISTPPTSPSKAMGLDGRKKSLRKAKKALRRQISGATSFVEDPKVTVADTLKKISERCLQPPVVGALLGIFVASIPAIRGIFVDLVHRANAAPLQWFFDGLYSVGSSAVPINMIILGCNISASELFSFGPKRRTGLSEDKNAISNKTLLGIVIGKMVILPIIGILSAVVLRTYFWDIPKDIDAPFFLVLMIVFITPTANNVMVMVELSGSASKEGMARVIGIQYLCSPIILSVTVAVVVNVASQWMHDSIDGGVGETYHLLA